jgi:hypothetical protein
MPCAGNSGNAVTWKVTNPTDTPESSSLLLLSSGLMSLGFVGLAIICGLMGIFEKSLSQILAKTKSFLGMDDAHSPSK